MPRLALIAAPEDSGDLPTPLASPTPEELVAELKGLGLSTECVESGAGVEGFDALLVDPGSPEAERRLAEARDCEMPSILISVLRPKGPWFLDIDPEERTALIAPWSEDFEKRRDRSLELVADAYADSSAAIAEALTELLDSAPPKSKGPSLSYRGALFNTLAGVAVGTSFELPVGRDLILGRGKGVALVTHSPQIARHHLRLHVHPDGSVETTDLGGTNGNWLCREGMPAEQLPQGGKSINLSHGDQLAIAGDFRMQYLRG
jgi:hypothetical protein